MPPPTRAALAQTAAVSVATILGSGILGLPVSLARSGLPPFLAAFTLTCVAQVAVVYATTELLQRATAAKRAGAAGARRAAYRPLPYQAATALDRDAALPTAKWTIEDGSGDGGGGVPAGGEAFGHAEDGDPETRNVRDGSNDAADDVFGDVGDDDCAAPGLHAFAELYLPTLWLKVLFELAVLFHFVSIMSSYALGAPQAFREVFPFLKVIPETVMVLTFTIIAALIVTFFSDAIVVPLTLATFVKGSLLTVMVCFVLAVGVGVGVKPSTDWSFGASVEPFLMGTLALSGVVNLMPKLWDISVKSTGLPSQTAVDRDFVVQFRAAVNSALVLCYVLNVMWCIGVLMVVPQGLQEPPARQLLSTFNVVPLLRQFSESTTGGGETAAVTLSSANDLGQISTVPLVEVLKSRGTQSAAASVVINLVNVFVFISISVSFMVMGMGLTQMCDEMADSLVDWHHARLKERDGTAVGRPTTGRRRAARHMLAAIFFVLITVISATNPKALLHIMAGFTSMALNMEGGMLIIIMFMVSRARGSAHPSRSAGDSVERGEPGGFHGIPAPISRGSGWALVVLVLSFFSFAVGVDFIVYLPGLFKT